MPNQIIQPPLPRQLALFGGDPGAGGAATLAANTAFLVPAQLWRPATLTNIRVQFGTGGAGHYDVGIYDSSGANGVAGNLLAHAASTATALVTATGVQTPALIGGNLALAPGLYWLALWIDNITDTVIRTNGQVNLVVAQKFSSAGPLPATAAALSNTNAEVVLLGLLSGGWS